MPSRRSRPDPRTGHRPAERNGPRWPADCRGAEAADDMFRVEPDAIDEGGTPRVVPAHPGKYSPPTRSRPPVPWDRPHATRRPARCKTLAAAELTTSKHEDRSNTRRRRT